MDIKSKIILISGPTASGKSKFALRLAKKIDGEIINADSMQIYKDLSILTARPLKKDLKIEVRPTTKEDIIQRQLPPNISGLIITKIEPDSPINYLKVNDIIVEAGKRKIKSANQLNNLVNTALKSQNKTILIAIFNNQNQKRYIGVKLD